MALICTVDSGVGNGGVVGVIDLMSMDIAVNLSDAASWTSFREVYLFSDKCALMGGGMARINASTSASCLRRGGHCA